MDRYIVAEMVAKQHISEEDAFHILAFMKFLESVKPVTSFSFEGSQPNLSVFSCSQDDYDYAINKLSAKDYVNRDQSTNIPISDQDDRVDARPHGEQRPWERE